MNQFAFTTAAVFAGGRGDTLENSAFVESVSGVWP